MSAYAGDLPDAYVRVVAGPDQPSHVAALATDAQ